MDIVERLREKADRKSPNDYMKQRRIETEAADEIERLRLSRELHIKLYKNKKEQLDILREALEMVRDADNDCHLDGLQTIPSPARAKIDAALKETE